MVDVDVEDGFRYPLRGEAVLQVHAIGGGIPVLLNVAWILAFLLGLFFAPLLLALVLLVPLQLAVGVLWTGYFVRVAGRTFEGATEPPPFDDPGGLARDGLLGSLVVLAYGVPAIVLTGGVYVVMFASIFGMELVGESDPGAGLAAGMVGILAMVVGSVVVMLYAVVAAYLLPASLVAYADERSLGGAFSLARLKRLALSTEYAVPWIAVAGAYFFVYNAVSVLSLVLVGSLLAPLLPLAYFSLGVAGFYMFAQAYASEVGTVVGSSAESAIATSVPPPREPPGDRGREEG